MIIFQKNKIGTDILYANIDKYLNDIEIPQISDQSKFLYESDMILQ